MGPEIGLEDSGNRETMALVEQVRSVRIAEVELIVEVNAMRHEVLGKSVGALERQAVAEATLALHKQRVVVVHPRCDERIDLAEAAG